MRSMLRAEGERIHKNRKQRRINRDNWHRRFSFEQSEARNMLANTDTSGAFSVLLDNAPGDVNGFDGNLALSQSGLVYNSRTVADTEIQFVRQLPNVGGWAPTSVSATLTFNNQPWGTFHWNIDPNAGIDSKVLFRVPLSFTTLATGRYGWSMSATYNGPGGSLLQNFPTSFVSYINRADSEFGKGWYHQDLAKLQVYSGTGSDGLLLITGDGEPTWFGYSGGVYTREPGDQHFYTVTYDSTHFTLTDKFGSSMKFLNNTPFGWARLESMFDVAGNERRFWYDANHVLQSIQHMPTGNSTAFTYAGGYVSAITEYVGTKSRSVSMTTSSGQLTSITLPDPDDYTASQGLNGPLSSPRWDFAYSGTSGLLTTSIDPIGNQTAFTYGSSYADAETVTSIKQAADTSYLTPFTTNGTGSTNAFAPGLLKLVPSNLGQFTDERGKHTSFGANEIGFITEIRDDDNNVWTYDRNSEGLISRIVTPDLDGTDPTLTKLETTFTYDSRGNITSETKRPLGDTAILARQTWEYGDNDYSLPTEHIDEVGRVTKFSIGPKSGFIWNRGKILSMTEIVGIDDAQSTTGEMNDAITTYTYLTSIGNHVGLLGTVTDPSGRVTKYEYWSTDPRKGLLKKVTYNHGAFLTAPTDVEFEYDDFRNRSAVLDELDRRTEFLYDRLDGLVKQTDPDPDAGQSKYVSPVTQFAYDPTGKLVRTIDPMANVAGAIYDSRNRVVYDVFPRPNATIYSIRIKTRRRRSLGTGRGSALQMLLMISIAITRPAAATMPSGGSRISPRISTTKCLSPGSQALSTRPTPSTKSTTEAVRYWTR